MSARKRRLAIVGNGMATCRLLDELERRGGFERFEIDVFGDERGGAYNRVLLSKVLAGDEPDAIITKTPDWFAAREIKLHDGVSVRRLDTAAKRVETSDGSTHRYDVAVLATGSQPRVPPLEGMITEAGDLLAGVFVYRTMEDCLRMRGHARPGHAAVVLGGGLLGLEAAKVLSDAGLHVTVVHAARTLMNAQLDELGGEMLERQIESHGIFVRTGRTIEAILIDEEGGGGGQTGTLEGFPDPPATTPLGKGQLRQRVEGVRLDDGKVLAAELVVLACGVRPRVDVARASGLPINNGIVVNDTLATEASGVYAIGDCAEHAGRTYGIVAPAWEQAAVLADVLTGANPQARYRGSKTYTRLKVAGVDVASMGRIDPELERDEVIQVVETRRGSYRKLIVRGTELIGAMLVGNTAASASLVQALDRGDPLPDDPLEALCPNARFDAPACADRLICNCNAVPESRLRAAIAAGAASVEELALATRAGTGCGSCKTELVRLLNQSAAAAPPKKVAAAG